MLEIPAAKEARQMRPARSLHQRSGSAPVCPTETVGRRGHQTQDTLMTFANFERVGLELAKDKLNTVVPQWSMSSCRYLLMSRT